MRKSFLFTLLALVTFTIQLSAEPVTLEKAQAEAREFLESIGAQVGELTLVEAPTKESPTRDETVYYYLFNFGQDGGFVIISGDDRTQPVLGYSEEGHVTESDINNSLRPMLETYKEELSVVDKVATVAYSGPKHVQSPSYSPVAPLVTCHWSQLSPYNSECPTINGKNCPTGCLATAIGQVCYAYRDRMPDKLPVTIPAYKTKTKKLSIKSVPKGTAFNWNMMTDALSMASSSQIKAVANLLAYVGKALTSDFRQDATSATWSALPSTITTYFAFASGIKQIRKSAYTAARWQELLTNELIANRPVVIYGENYQGSAHAFIIDGFDGGDMFHVNWGWGRGDGYFLLSVMNPLQPNNEEASASYEKSYNKNLMAFIGIQPVNGYSEPADDNTLMSTINSVETKSAKFTFKNQSKATQKYVAGLGYFDENKRIQLLKKWSLGKKSIESGASVTGVEIELTTKDFSSLKLAAGTYKLYPIYMVDGNEDWMACDQSSSYSYVKADYKSSSLTLSKVKSTPSFTVSDVKFPGSHAKGYNQFVSFNVTNVGDEGVGTLYLYASTSSSYSSSSSKIEMSMTAGEKASVQLQFLPKSTGTYNVWITDGTNVLKKTSVKIVSASSSSVYSLATSGFSVDNLKEGSTVKLYGNTMKGKVTFKNTGSLAFAGYVSVYLYKLSGSNYVSTLERSETYLELEPGAKSSIEFCFEGLKYGQKYGLFPLYEDTRGFIKPYSYGYVCSPGVIMYTPDGKTTAYEAESTVTVPSNVVAVDISGVASDISKVSTNNNPNTLYYMEESESSPTGLSGKNVIKGDVAKNIALTDGYEFYVPKRFKATNITFSRTPTIGTNGSGGWTSIVMPFDVEELTVNDEKLDWFKSDTDYGKNLWVKEFQGISGQNTVCFGYAQKMIANNPYIMAVPNSKWGKKYDLVGKKLVFHGSNAILEKEPSILVGSDLMNFRGTYTTLNTTNTYVLNSTGTKFSFGSNKVKPFYGFFVAKDLDVFGVGDLNIGSFEDETNGILMLFETDDNQTVDVYNVSGMKVGTAEMQNGVVNLGNLPKGVYVVNGKKIMK